MTAPPSIGTAVFGGHDIRGATELKQHQIEQQRLTTTGRCATRFIGQARVQDRAARFGADIGLAISVDSGAILRPRGFPARWVQTPGRTRRRECVTSSGSMPPPILGSMMIPAKPNAC